MYINFSSQARDDLHKAARDAVENGSEGAANQLLTRLQHSLQQLLQYPNSASPYSARPEYRRQVVIVQDGLFLIFYRVKGDAIEIAHLRRTKEIPF
jgi:plasmid stabilization system protein ParE